MTNVDRQIAEVARLLQPSRGALDGSPYVHMLQGVVVGVSLGGLDVHFRGMVNSTPNVRYLSSYVPGFGNNVWCARFGSDLICLGELETWPGSTGVLSGNTLIEPWHEVGTSGEPAFQNSWTNFGSVHETVGYALQSDGWVRLKGLIKDGSSLAATMFTLPLEYRPPILWGGQSISNSVNTSINITTGGAVSNPGAGSTAWVSLAGITWPTVETWERERDTHWFPLMRSINGWKADSSDIDVYPMIYRRADGWRYIKGNIEGGTATAGTTVAASSMTPEDTTAYSEMFSARESGVGQARIDIRGLTSELSRVTGGVGPLILVGVTYWSRRGENLFSVDPTYPHKSMQRWLNIADAEGGGFQNGWVNYNTGFGSTVEWRKFQFFKDDFGIVHIRGLVNGASKTSDTICTLPAGYRPLKTHVFPTVRWTAGGGTQGRLDVNADGTLVAVGAALQWHSIWGQFKAEA